MTRLAKIRLIITLLIVISICGACFIFAAELIGRIEGRMPASIKVAYGICLVSVANDGGSSNIIMATVKCNSLAEAEMKYKTFADVLNNHFGEVIDFINTYRCPYATVRTKKSPFILVSIDQDPICLFFEPRNPERPDEAPHLEYKVDQETGKFIPLNGSHQ